MLVVVVEILAPQRDPEDSLSHKSCDLMFDQTLIPLIVKLSGKPVHQPDRTTRPKRQRAAS
jgi:hypothetical protein